MMYHVNGRLVPREKASVSVHDRGFRYGDAAFETLRAYGGEVFAWNVHIERLERTCDALGMADAIPDDLALRVADTLDANDLEDAYVRLSITRGVQPGKLTPRTEVDPTIVVVCDGLPRGGRRGSQGKGKEQDTNVWDSHATVQTVKTRRVPDASIPVDAKTHNYLNGILARLELRRATTDSYHPDEALLRDTENYVAEGATSNIFFVDNGTLKTPQRGTILPGITREIVLDLASDESFPVETGRYTLEDVRSASEAFLTNTTWELRPIETVDGISVGGGPITTLLARLFDAHVEQCCYSTG